MLRRWPRTGSGGLDPGLPARYSGARIGSMPPVRETAARVAHCAGRGAMPGTAVVSHPARVAPGAGRRGQRVRAPPFKFAFFSRLSYWCDIRCAWICAMKSITTTTTISSEVPPK